MNRIAIIVISLLIVFTYWKLPNTFFQQDEWETFAVNIYAQSNGLSGIVKSILPVDSLSHFNPLSRVFSLFQFFFYYTNFTPYAWQSIIFHTFNASLLYYFAYIWLKNRKIAFIAAIFFGINSIASGAVMWIAATDSYEIPMALILISLLFFCRFATQKDNRRRNLIISLTVLVVSFLFHENGIFLFVFYPAVLFLLAKSEWKKLLPSVSYGILISIFIFAFIRIPFFFGFIEAAPDVKNFSHPELSVYPYRLMSMGMKSFAGSIIPEKTLIFISEKVVKLAYPQFLTPDKTPNPFIAQSIVFDLVSYMLTVLIVCLLILFLRVIQGNKIREAFIWTLIFIPMSLTPYVFVLGNAGFASIIESKFFYIGNIGVSILVGIIVSTVLLKFSKRKLLKTCVYLLFGLYLLSHMYIIKMKLVDLEKVSIQRKMILTKIQTSYPNLPQKIVFYTQSDSAYYGMPDNEKMLPMQIGFGRILITWYQKGERFPGCLYEGRFLLNLLEEGYRFCEGRGFGYFRDYDKLVAEVGANDIKPEEIIAFSWEKQKGKFTDITEKFRSTIKQDIERNR